MSYWETHDPPMSFIPEGWTYEAKRAFRYECIPYLPALLKVAAGYAGRRILCIGDGSGIDAVELAKAGASVTVIDMSQKAVELTRRHAGEAGVKLVASVGDACKLDFFDHIFDAVYSFGVIHHIPEVDKAVGEIARVLKRGGDFMGMVYHRDSLLYAYSILLRGQREGLSPDEAMRAYSERNPDCPHSVAYSIDDLRALLKHDFAEVNTEIHYNVIDTPTQRKVPFTTPEGLDLGWHLCFSAVK